MYWQSRMEVGDGMLEETCFNRRAKVTKDRGYERGKPFGMYYILLGKRSSYADGMDCNASFILKSMYQVPQRFLGLICMARVFAYYPYKQ
jgi:hypothetical protein